MSMYNDLPASGPPTGHCARVKRRWGTLNRLYTSYGWLEHYQQLANQIMPRKGRYLKSMDINSSDPQRGTQLNGQILNITPIIAARTLTAGLMSGVTNPARPWFRLTLPLSSGHDGSHHKTAVWLHDVQEILRVIFHEAGVYRVLGMAYDELGVFGTGCCGMEDDFEDVILLTPFTVGEYRVAVDAKGRPNTVYRQFLMTVWQLVSKFGKSKVSQNVRDMYERKEYDEDILVLNGVEPNPDFNPESKSRSAKPYVSVYIEANGGKENEGKQTPLRVGYHSYFPFLVPRWHITGNDPYGRSCGMEALPFCKSLNKLELRKAQMVDRATMPSMQGPPSLRNDKKSLMPGSMTYVADPTGKGIRPTYIPSAEQINAVAQEISRQEAGVQSAFYTDLFMQMLSSDRREMTAEEVRERSGEKLVLLSPVLQQIEGDLLMPLIRNTYMSAMKAGILPSPPDEVKGHPVRVEFVSILHQAQRAAEITGIERIMAFAGSLQAVDPMIMDNLDPDKALRLYTDYLGANPEILRDWDVVQQMRQAKEEQMRRDKMMEMGPEMVNAAANLAKVDVGGGQTAMAKMIGAGGPVGG